MYITPIITIRYHAIYAHTPELVYKAGDVSGLIDPVSLYSDGIDLYFPQLKLLRYWANRMDGKKEGVICRVPAMASSDWNPV